MSAPTSPSQELANLFDRFADQIFEMPDSVFNSLMDERGTTVNQTAAITHQVIQSADKAYRQRHLTAAKEQYAKSVSHLASRSNDVPATPEERRGLLERLLNWNMNYGFALTLQNRNLKSLTDEDITRALRQLGALGAIKEMEKGQKK